TRPQASPMETPKNPSETITVAAQGEGKFIRQAGGQGQYGHVVIKLSPKARGRGVEISNEVVDGSIPAEFLPFVTDGIREGLRVGVVEGWPIVDVLVRVVDGSFHKVDSSALAFKMAGLFALKDALKKAKPIVLK